MKDVGKLLTKKRTRPRVQSEQEVQAEQGPYTELKSKPDQQLELEQVMLNCKLIRVLYVSRSNLFLSKKSTSSNYNYYRQL